MARVLDVSPRGARVEIAVPRPIRSRVEVVLRSDQGEIPVRASVHGCSVRGRRRECAWQGALLYRAGLEFDRPAPGLLSALGVEAGRKRVGEVRLRPGQEEPGS